MNHVNDVANLEEQDCIETACHEMPKDTSNVITFPVSRVSTATPQTLEGARMMGELPMLTPVGKAIHLERIAMQVKVATVLTLADYK